MNCTININNTVLETERLILRPWTMDDAQDMFDYAQDKEVGPRAGWPPHKNIEESKKIVNMFIEGNKTFAIELKENKKVIGSVGIEFYSDSIAELLGEKYAPLNGREIGYVLSHDYWGRGIMPEAVKRVIRWCFEEAGCDFLVCGHFVYNDQSRRVIEKCGFGFLGDEDYHTRAGAVEKAKIYLLEK